MARRFTSLSGRQLGASLARKLVGVTDSVRDLRTRLGGNVHAVYLVWIQWSGGRRGAGAPVEVARTEILPVPVVTFSLDYDMAATGRTEDGQAKVSEVSGRYASDLLVGNRDGEAPSKDIDFMYEVIEIVPGSVNVRRRFTLIGAPEYNPAPPGWTVTLTRAYDDLDLEGQSVE